MVQGSKVLGSGLRLKRVTLNTSYELRMRVRLTGTVN